MEPKNANSSTAAPINSLTERSLGFMLPHEQYTVPQLVEFAGAAERAGFDFVATSDHLQPWQANEGHSGLAWVTMAALAQKTNRIWMGTTVTCPTFRYNPAVVAEAFASLSLLYPGRVFLGVGSGEAINEQAATGYWPNWNERSERLIEATQVIRDLWKGQPVNHRGRYYKLDMRLYDPPAKPIPLLMAANGPKAMRRAGQYADGLVSDPKTWKEHKAEFEAGAKAAGKDPRKMPVLIEQFVFVGDKKDAEQAAALWRFIPKAWNPYYNVLSPVTIEERAKKEVTMEEVYSGWTVSSDSEVHFKTVNELFASGATMVNIHTAQPDQSLVINFYGQQVLPRVRRVSAAAG